MSTLPAPTFTPDGTRDLWIRRYRPVETPAVRLVCFPHAGGSASAYLPFSRELAPWVEVLAVQYPGRQDRRSEPFIDTVDELAHALLPELEPWTGEPLALFGHSLGSIVAYETARLLTAGGARPLHLLASGCPSPKAVPRDVPPSLDDDSLLAEVARLQGTDTTLLAEELLRMHLPALRNDYRAAGAYRHRPGPALDCPLTVLTGDQDPNVPVEEARDWFDLSTDPRGLHVFPGGHFYLNDRTEAVCRTIEEALGHAR